MSSSLRTVAEASRLIEAGRPLLLAGEAALLARLPRGSWIGGSTPYFVTADGGACVRDALLVTELPAAAEAVRIDRYDATTIDRVHADGAACDFSVMIVPAASPTHLAFALGAPTYPAFGVKPLVGWVSGVHLSELGRARATAFDGRTASPLEDGAVVLRARLATRRVAEVGIVNIFDPGDAPVIEFEEDGLVARQALVDGVRRPLAAWIAERKLDLRLPLVANYLGARINVSFQGVDHDAGLVRFYAPVFAGVKYSPARPVADHAGELVRRLPDEAGERIAFSCNCVLNYAELEGKRTGAFVGPVTFGEIAYQLLNQTLVYLAIRDAAA